MSEEGNVTEQRGAEAAVEVRYSEDVASRPFYFFFKRIFDVAASAVAMVILFPLLPVIALLIKLDSKGPVFFTQPRLGRNGTLFNIYKFRSMAHQAAEIRNADGSRFVAENDPRLTRVGRFLRDYSIDELPQLLNILKGEMSVVGPRPDTPEAPGLDAEIYRKKRLVRPGLTSLAAIHGRNSIPWKDRIEWEIRYVEGASFALDLTIICKTIFLVFRREGIYTSNQHF